MSEHGHVLKIFVMSGEFKDFQFIELANWSGKAFLGDRNHIGICSKREELSKSGVYILLSKDQNDDGVFQIYIGETDNFSKRISKHSKSKKWWDKFIVFTSGDDNLTKAHVRYLERELFLRAKKNGAPVELMNTSEPGGANLSEAEISFGSTYLDNMIFTLKTLGLDYFDSKNEASPELSTLAQTILMHGERFYTLHLKEYSSDGEPLKAFMKLENGNFIVEKGSYIRLEPTPSFKTSGGYYKLWMDLVSSKKVVKSDIKELGVIQEDIEFSSASASGSVIRAKSTNGMTRWLSCNENRPLKEYIGR